MSQGNALADLVVQVIADKASGKYAVTIDPRKYGLDTEEEYWRYVRELADGPPKKL